MVGDLTTGFYVADDAPGIPAEERERIFDPGCSLTEEGVDFVIEIVQKRAQAHGWVSDVTEGQEDGTRFLLSCVEFIDGAIRAMNVARYK